MKINAKLSLRFIKWSIHPHPSKKANKTKYLFLSPAVLNRLLLIASLLSFLLLYARRDRSKGKAYDKATPISPTPSSPYPLTTGRQLIAPHSQCFAECREIEDTVEECLSLSSMVASWPFFAEQTRLAGWPAMQVLRATAVHAGAHTHTHLACTTPRLVATNMCLLHQSL